MNEIRDSLPVLAVAVALLWLIRVACLDVFPGPARFLEHLLRRFASSVWELIWGIPMRGLGVIGPVWLITIVMAAYTTVATLAMFGDGNVLAGIGCLALSVVTWGLVVGTWYAARFLAGRRYTPRALPTRRRER